MFSEKNSTLAKQYSALWRLFVKCFHDIAVQIRVKCVQSSSQFLTNHPELSDDVIDALKHQHNSEDETVRYEVVMELVKAAKLDIRIVSASSDLLQILMERTSDEKFMIRENAMKLLGLVYMKYSNIMDGSEVAKKEVNWIKNKILHGYYITDVEDRLLVERLLICF